MKDTYAVSVQYTEDELYMTDSSMMNFSENINSAKKFASEEETKDYMDDNFIPLSWWIGSNSNSKLQGVYICSISNNVVKGRSRYL